MQPASGDLPSALEGDGDLLARRCKRTWIRSTDGPGFEVRPSAKMSIKSGKRMRLRKPWAPLKLVLQIKFHPSNHVGMSWGLLVIPEYC